MILSINPHTWSIPHRHGIIKVMPLDEHNQPIRPPEQPSPQDSDEDA